MRVLLLVLVAGACARSDLAYFLAAEVEFGAVEDIYPGNGSWNDYVRRSELDRDWLSQPNVACTGEEFGLHSVCIHGGEKKEVVVDGATTCDGLTADDQLGAFRWLCRVRDDGAVALGMVGLHHDQGLADLVTAGGFRPNRVRVYSEGELIGSTDSTTWWDNPVVAAPPLDGANIVPLVDEGVVYVVDINRTGAFSLEADRQAFVTLPGVTLRYHGGAPNCDHTLGERLPEVRGCVLITNGQKFLWIEANVDAQPPTGSWAAEPMVLADIIFSQVRHTTVANALSNNFRIRQRSRSNFVYRTAIANCDDENGGFDEESHDNVFYDFKSFHADWQGLHFAGPTSSNIVVRALLTGNQEEGVWGMRHAVLSHVTVAANATVGIEFIEWAGTVVQAIIAGNGGAGVHSDPQGDHYFANLAVAHNGGNPIVVDGNGGHNFEGVLAIGAGESCSADGVEPGIDASCNPANGSTHVLRTGLDLTGSFVGPIGAHDAVNSTNDANGQSANENGLDWHSFEDWHRTWGAAASAMVPGEAGNCEGRACAIWDWRLRRSDTMVRNKSGDGTGDNEAFVPGQPCPAAVHGDVMVAPDLLGVFLRNAVEIVLDSVGDDDGLCESDEACLYSPNLGGAYQGHGDWLSRGTCTFQDGQVRRVQMYAYPENGV